ncbi:hypothetical protein [Micromonospora sp. CPCC 206061]|uniref:hypothetical protein n=1 Tax=Micromonospora sp. CPCC 206061 TaxID=3122410 RepID=UPI002FF1A92A
MPWLTYAAQPSLPEQAPKLGWMSEALEIDPFNSNRMMYGGASVYGTTNLTALDTGGTVNLAPMVRGQEESVVSDLVSHPSGALFSGLFDVGGFRHTNVDAVPALMYTPFTSAVASIDYDRRCSGRVPVRRLRVSWVRINDDQHQYGNADSAITGDPKIYGRVDLGTDGRGILVADPAGPPSTHRDVAAADEHPDVASAATDGQGWLLCHVCEDRPVGHRQRRLPGRGADRQHRNDRHHELDGDHDPSPTARPCPKSGAAGPRSPAVVHTPSSTRVGTARCHPARRRRSGPWHLERSQRSTRGELRPYAVAAPPASWHIRWRQAAMSCSQVSVRGA